MGHNPEVVFLDENGREVERQYVAGMTFREMQTMMQQRGFKYEPTPVPPGGYSWMQRFVNFRAEGGIGPNAKIMNMPMYQFLPQNLFGGAATAQHGAVQGQRGVGPVHMGGGALGQQPGAVGSVGVLQHASQAALRAQSAYGQPLSVHTVMHPQGEAVVVQDGVPHSVLAGMGRRLHAADSQHNEEVVDPPQPLAKQGSPVGRHLPRRKRAAAAHVFFDALAQHKQRLATGGRPHASQSSQSSHQAPSESTQRAYSEPTQQANTQSQAQSNHQTQGTNEEAAGSSQQ